MKITEITLYLVNTEPGEVLKALNNFNTTKGKAVCIWNQVSRETYDIEDQMISDWMKDIGLS